jgi:hypothetical protein
MSPIGQRFCASEGENALRARQSLLQLEQQRPLVTDDLVDRFRKPEPRRAVDLREALAPAGTWRPFDLERIASELCRIEIALAGERMRLAVASRSLSAAVSASPLGMVQAPASFFAQNGPPGWASRTSMRRALRR